MQLGSEAVSASQRLPAGSACTARVPLPSRHTPLQLHAQQSLGHTRVPVYATQETQEAPLVPRGTENLEGKARPTYQANKMREMYLLRSSFYLLPLQALFLESRRGSAVCKGRALPSECPGPFLPFHILPLIVLWAADLFYLVPLLL